MYRVCQKCSTSHVQFHVTDVDTESMVEYFEWKAIRTEVPCKEKMKTVTMTVKEKEKATIKNLMNDFENDLMKCCSHLYNIRHQYLSIRQLKEKLISEDMLLHIDFSENYTGKYDQEIQSVHFGGSSKQISLHTGVLYTEETTIPFCSMSDELLHNPAAIWAHLMPVFEFSKQKFLDIRNLYLLSDGPTTQYRNKENFMLLSTEPYKLGYEKINWNFTEAGHGKGTPDGVGGTIKREADRIVSHGIGNDITSAKQLFNALKQKDCKMELFLVDEEKINYYTQLLKLTKLSPVPGTMKIHQIFSESPGNVTYRDVSCFCKIPDTCACYNPRKATLYTPVTCTIINEPSLEDKEAKTGSIKKPDLDDTLIEQYCVVKYDGRPYPGIIQAVDADELEVNVMHCIGENRFFWPRMDDVLWYTLEKVLTLIPHQKN